MKWLRVTCIIAAGVALSGFQQPSAPHRKANEKNAAATQGDAAPKQKPPQSTVVTAPGDTNTDSQGVKSDGNENIQIVAPAPEKPVDLVERIISVIGVLCTLALAIVGICGIYIALDTLGEMKGQREQMGRQVEAAILQLNAMHEQITKMEVQNAIAKETADAAKDSAKAAQDGANAAQTSANAAQKNIELVINKESALIKVQLLPFELRQPNMLLGHEVKYSVICLGPTIASIDYAVAEAEVSDSEEPPTGTINIFGQMNIGTFISPRTQPIELLERTPLLNKIAIDRIEQGMSFVHFRGLIKYRDFMGRKRETAVCWTWKMTGVYPYFVNGKWIMSGPPEANRET